MNTSLIIALVVTVLVILIIARTAIIIPQQHAYVVERLGKFSRVLGAGFHILMPFVDIVRYKHILKETTLDTPRQECITRDNVHVAVDAILYFKILDPEKASYGVEDFRYSIAQLAQTTLRSEIGKMELDSVLEERATINNRIVAELDKASESWGIKVFRFELQHIDPPADVLEAMERQMRAERDKRATVLVSEGERDATINSAEALKVQMIRASEAKKIKQVNEAEGEAEAILELARATAQGIEVIAQAISKPGGREATQLKLASQYIEQFGNLAQKGNTMIVPANLTDISSMLALATQILSKPAKESSTPPALNTVIADDEDNNDV
jgi:regulator of protease activity HflC (stomatin/prohibitin superfamily)